jgi:tetratricopeptide (TPR) repeat protein/tRNA A-37 threonylcarbamoyl transferase component Bud32
MGLDESIEGDSRPTRSDSLSDPGSTRSMDLEPTEALATSERVEAEAGLLYGLLAAAGGLVAPEALTRSLGAWARSPGRSLREVLVARGHLDEAVASLVDALASASLGRHGGSTREALVALGGTARFRIEPDEIADPMLRRLLAGLVEDRREAGSVERYEVIREHARGGLGVISLARDREIHRDVAVKEIRHDYADDPDAQARFLREAEVTGRLEHPGIVPVYGIGYHDDGRPYYIMRFIRGETLKAAIARLHKAGDKEVAGAEGRGDLHSLIGRFIDACHAVAYAHHRKILHRDLKPVNIMLGPFGETLVVDWGLAKSFDGSSSGSDLITVDEGTLRPQSGSGMTPTRYGSKVGTIGYMSPEQAAGRLTELGPPSDIYSLGVILTILGTGRAPFERIDEDEFFRRVRQGEFPRPSQLNPSIPLAIEAICLKAMALRPVDRYQTVGELIDDLECWRAGQPVDAYPEPFVDRLARWAKRHRTALAAAAVLLVCATVGLAAYAALERRENRRVEAERQVAQADLTITRELFHQLLDGLSGPGLTYLSESGPPRLELVRQLIAHHRDLIAKHPADPTLKHEMARAILVQANIRRSIGQFDEATKDYDEAIGLLANSDADPDPIDARILLASVYIDRGENHRLAGRPGDAEPNYLEAIEIRKGLPADPEDDRVARIEAKALIDLAACRAEVDRPREAGPQAVRAVEILSELAGRPVAQQVDRLLLIYAINVLATTRRGSGEWQAARDDLADAIGRAKELRSTWENTDSRYAMALSLNERGLVLGQLGDHAGAATEFGAAFAILADLWKKNQRVPFMEGDLAASLGGRGAARLALLKGKLDPNALILAQKDCVKAREYLEQLVVRWPGHYVYQSLLGQSLATLGRIAEAQGNADQAHGLLTPAHERHKLALKANPNSPDDKILEPALRREIEARTSRPDAPR